jgi:hypothetical protein
MSQSSRNIPDNNRKQSHEHQPGLSPVRREANVKRWPIRHTALVLGDRTLWGAYHETATQIEPQPDASAIARNVVTLATEQPMAQEQAVTDPKINAVVTPLDANAILKNIENIHANKPNSHD